MRKKMSIKKIICLLSVLALFVGVLTTSYTSLAEIPEDEVPLSALPEDDSFLLNMSKFELWESGQYDQETGEKSVHRRRMRTSDPIIRKYIEYYIELSEDMNLIFYEYDAQMNYLGCNVLADGDTFMPQEATRWFTITLYRTYSEKSLSPGQWKTIFSQGISISVIHGNDMLNGSASTSDVFLLDMSYFQLWESGDYSEENGEAIEHKRRLRYPMYIDNESEYYLIELSDDLKLIVFEFDDSMNYLGCTTFSNGERFVPNSATTQFTVTVHRKTSEKSMSYGQWKAFFANKVKIRISYGDISQFELEKDKLLCTTSEPLTSEEELVAALLNDEGDRVANGLWNNLISNGVYALDGHDLDNGNLTIYVSSSEGSDNNSGLSPLYPKASLEQYSGVSNINVLLKCGDTFQMSDSFLVGNNSVYAAYGEGKRPKLDYYRNLDLLFKQVDGYENMWVADVSELDICNRTASKSNCNMGQLLINGEVNWKRKVGSTSDMFDPLVLAEVADGGWSVDWHTNQLYLYSDQNPNDCNISYAPPLHAITMNKVENVIFNGIEIVGAGMHGISMKNVDNINISGCYIHHVGGSILVSAGVRYGNAVQLWDSGSNVTVSHNFSDWIFDTCYTNQGNNGTAAENNVLFIKNIGAHSFWGLETWGDAYSANSFMDIRYAYNIIYDMMDVTNPDTPMYSSKSGKVIFANANMKKEDYVSYRCGYTYNQMSSVNVNNGGTGDPVKIHDNIFWNTNRFLAIITNDRSEAMFSCLYNNLFYGETDVAAPALFRYTIDGGAKNYLESPEGYIDASNKVTVWPGGAIGDNSAELEALVALMKIISGTNNLGGLN